MGMTGLPGHLRIGVLQGLAVFMVPVAVVFPVPAAGAFFFAGDFDRLASGFLAPGFRLLAGCRSQNGLQFFRGDFPFELRGRWIVV